MFCNDISREAVHIALEKPWISTLELLATDFGMKRNELINLLNPIDIGYLNDLFAERNSQEYKAREKTKIGVLDTSIVGYPGFLDFIRKRFDFVILTTLTLTELNRLKDKPTEKNHLSAQALLKHSTEDKVFFKTQKLKVTKSEDEDGANNDSDMQIIQFVKSCDNPNLTIVTADFGMSKRAEGEHVNCVLLESGDYDRMHKVELNSVFQNGIVQNEPCILIKNSSGYNKQLPHKLEIGDEIFILSREKVRGKKQTIFKHLKCISQSELAIIRKVFIKDDEPCILFSYKELERKKLVEFVNSFREQDI